MRQGGDEAIGGGRRRSHAPDRAARHGGGAIQPGGAARNAPCGRGCRLRTARFPLVRHGSRRSVLPRQRRLRAAVRRVRGGAASARAASARLACPGAPSTERRGGRRGPWPSARSRVSRWCVSVSVGKPAIRSAPRAMPGRASRARRARARPSARRWRRRIRFRIRSAPCWSERCRCGMSRGSSASRSPEPFVEDGGVQGGQAQAREVGNQREQSPKGGGEARPIGQIGAVGGDVDAGEHGFAVALLDKAPQLIGQRVDRDGDGRTAALGDHAEGAAVVAAVLDLDEGAGAGDAWTGRRRGDGRRHPMVAHRGSRLRGGASRRSGPRARRRGARPRLRARSATRSPSPGWARRGCGGGRRGWLGAPASPPRRSRRRC